MSALAQKADISCFMHALGRAVVDLPPPLHQVVIHLKTEEECFGAYE
jgi:hypothetical protein